MPRKPVYQIVEGSIHERAFASRRKIIVFAGGFANGKTAWLSVKAAQIAKDYPGANMLLARSTYPKLNDTLRKEFKKWLPPSWIKSFPVNTNTCTLTNGTEINFRYVQQQGKSNESSTSNLLSATYDFIGVDQVEDPEITYKDFLDLLGRLRGMAPYVGDDPTMPATGPRQMILTANPTRNWVYTKLVKPYQDWERTGVRHPELLWDDEKDEPMIEVFNAPTHANAENLESDFIKTLEAAYTGVMKERFLLGSWGAYEGLVYPQYTQETHQLSPNDIQQVLDEMGAFYRAAHWFEAYDWGKIVPSCYGLFFADARGNVYLVDGFYKAEYDLDEQVHHIHRIRRRWTGSHILNCKCYADPSILRGGVMKGGKLVGEPIGRMMEKYPNAHLRMVRGNNHLTNGIVKVSAYMSVVENHPHPITGVHPSPHFYHNEELTWFTDEITNYMWKKHSTHDTYMDEPTDRDDHAMDMLKYAFTDRPNLPTIIKVPQGNRMESLLHWGEGPDEFGISARYT